jgi:hypothetical protein
MKNFKMPLSTFIFLAILMTSLEGFAQSKKEQIESLNFSIDSLNKLVEVKNFEIKDFNLKLEQQSSKIQDKDKIILQLNNELTAINSQQKKTQKSLDSAIVANNSSSPFSSKKQILTRLIGSYELDNIDGSSGANFMFETRRDGQGEWASSNSEIVDRMREGFIVELTQKDLNLLNNLKIEVDSNLKVILKSGTQVIFTSQFNEKGMDYNVNKVDDYELDEKLNSINESTIFSDDELMLYAKNGIDLENYLKGRTFDVVLNDAMILSYDLFAAEFVLNIFSSCCGTNTLIFKKEIF